MVKFSLKKTQTNFVLLFLDKIVLKKSNKN